MKLKNKKDLEKIKYSTLIFLLVLLFNIFTSFQGLDISDEGYHLIQSQMAFPEQVTGEFETLFFLSNYVGGAWLYLHSPSLWWARLGGSLIEALTALLAFLAITEFFSARRSFYPTLVGSFLVSVFNPVNLIHYFTFPAFLTTLLLYLFAKTIRKKNLEKTKSLHFILGITLAFTIFSRFTQVLLLSIPFLIFIFLKLKKKKIPNTKLRIVFTTIGLLVGVSFMLILPLFSTSTTASLDNQFVDGIYQQSKATIANDTDEIGVIWHEPLGLLIKYLKEYSIIAILVTIYLFLLFITSKLNVKLQKSLIIGGSLVGLFAFSSLMSGFYYGRIISDGITFLLVGLIVFFTYFYLKKYANSNGLFLLVVVAAMLINPLGSASGTRKAFFAMWIAFPLIYLLLPSLKLKSDLFKRILRVKSVLLSVFLIIALFYGATYAYQDGPKYTLNEGFDSPSLKGIYSTPDRVIIVDELLSELDKRVIEGEIAHFHDLPSLYYFTNTNVAFGQGWSRVEPLSKVRNDFESMVEKNKFPRLALFPKLNIDSDTWTPNNNNENQKFVKDSFLQEYEYSLIWENEAFELYQKQVTEQIDN